MAAWCGPGVRRGVLALITAGAGAAAQSHGLRCELRVEPAHAVAQTGGAAAGPWLEMSLANPGPADLRLLNWGTPFEGAWLQPFVRVSVDGMPVSYRGAMVKRGDPRAGDYVLIQAGAMRRARLDLAEAFDLSAPGRYRIETQVTLHDVIQGPRPGWRPLARHQPRPLECPAVEFSR